MVSNGRARKEAANSYGMILISYWVQLYLLFLWFFLSTDPITLCLSLSHSFFRQMAWRRSEHSCAPNSARRIWNSGWPARITRRSSHSPRWPQRLRRSSASTSPYSPVKRWGRVLRLQNVYHMAAAASQNTARSFWLETYQIWDSLEGY